jgi:hypothetical protein
MNQYLVSLEGTKIQMYWTTELQHPPGISCRISSVANDMSEGVDAAANWVGAGEGDDGAEAVRATTREHGEIGASIEA